MGEPSDGPIWIIGVPGSGKTTVGRRLARRLGRRFVDLDRVIEAKARQSIPEIFARRGETAFRRLESAALAAVLVDTGPAPVVACGGGIVSRKGNRERLSRSGIVLWLDLPVDVARKRCRTQLGARPLLADRRFFARTVARRLPHYRALGRRVDADARPDVVVGRALDALTSTPA
jgi:shikimate kinase